MRRRWLHALFLPLWALWFAFAITEPAAGNECPTHLLGVVATQAGMPGMHHDVPSAPPESNTPRCCTLTDCTIAPLAAVPPTITTVAFNEVIRSTEHPFRSIVTTAPSHPDGRLPLPLGPPHHSIA